ncbi:MAG: DUF488 domain-containing protein [Chloroflexota bacterium]|nr:DUF488 domain-containing protein [Chloroflexota bacterium]
MRIYTIGFTKKTAREFFEKLQSADAKYLLDTRLNNKSQLAGFAKKGNIEYFVEKLTEMEYLEFPLLAPTSEILKQYRSDSDWDAYEKKYNRLLVERKVARKIDPALFADGVVLLCSEPTAEKCHRRLAAEFLKDRCIQGAKIVHL